MSGPRVAVGIDLGTTNSAVALAREGRVALAPGPSGERLLPSFVFVPRSGPVVVGNAAREAGLLEPERFFQHWKRDVGDATAVRTLDGKPWGPVLLSSFVLRTLLASATDALFEGERIREAVVAVPAWYGDLERGCTLDSARIAGLESVRVLNEPTAAALAFGLDPARRGQGPLRALVYDLGGGTFDVTVVELREGAVKVLATAGEPRLGGKDWDDELLNLVSERFYEDQGVDPREDERCAAGLRASVEAAKHALSVATEAVVATRLPGQEGERSLRVTRDELEARTRGLLEQTGTQLEVVLEKARLTLGEIDAVLPTGGATRMPMVRALLLRLTGKEPLACLDPDEAVARGAALYAALLQRGSAPVQEVAPEAEPLVAGLLPGESGPAPGAPPPGIMDTDEDLPLLPGERRVPEVQDVVSHGLGVLLTTRTGFRNCVLIPAQTPVPVTRARRFFTVLPDQTSVSIKVLEGEDEDPEACALLGVLKVDGLPPGRPRGQRIEVSCRYDEDGRLQVAARDLASGRAAHATIARRGALAAAEVARLRALVSRRVP